MFGSDRGLLALGVAAVTITGVAAASAEAAAPRTSGSLRITVAGLPVGEHPAVRISGPRGFRRTVSRQGNTTVRALAAGKYTVRVSKAKITRAHGRIKDGAVARPLIATRTIAVRKGRRASINVGYGSIVNPGVRRLPQQPRAVEGPADAPTALVFAGRPDIRPGQLLSAAPTSMLPRGILATVTGVKRAAQTTVTISPASVFDALPNAEFDVPLSAQGKAARRGLGCTLSAGVLPRLAFSDVRASGGWKTTKVFGAEVRTGVHVAVSFNVDAGVKALYDETGGLSCGLSSPKKGFQGAIPPLGVPIYGGIGGELSASLTGRAKLSAGGRLKMSVGAETVGVPPALAWLPQVSAASPSLSASYEALEGEVSAGFGIDAEFGIGVLNRGGIHVNVGASLNFTAKPQDCRFHYALGEFAAGGTIGPYTISTPRSPGFTRPIGENFCQAKAPSGPERSPVPQNPAPSPSPSPVPRPIPEPPGQAGLVTPTGPTTGPGGLGFNATTRECPTNFMRVRAEGLDYGLGARGGSQTVRLNTEASGFSTQALGVGDHTLVVSCVNADGSLVWKDAGIPVTITAPQPTIALSTTTPSAGDQVEFTGLSVGSCPHVPGARAADLLLLSIQGPEGDLRRLAEREVRDGEPAVLQIPNTAPAGRYFAIATCIYGPNPPLTSAGYVTHAPATMTVARN